MSIKSFSLYLLFLVLALTALLYTPTPTPRQNVKEKKDLTGVKLYRKELTQPGLNLFNSRLLNNVYLMENSGLVLNSWKIDSHNFDVHYNKLDEEGNLYSISEANALFKYNWAGDLIWKKDIRAHHDLVFNSDKNLYALDVRVDFFEFEGVRYRTYHDDLVLITPEGEELDRFNLTDLVKPFTQRNLVKNIIKEAEENNFFGDFFHINSLSYIDREVPEIANPGDLIISVRNINLICIIDPKTRKLKWHWQSDKIFHQHNPSLLPDNRIMLFDNGSKEKAFSRIIEVDLYSKEIVKSYDGLPDNHFFTFSMGGVQRLANGNTLVTSSREGKVFELNPDDKIVWEFINPALDKQTRGPLHIYRMERYPLEPYKTLANLKLRR